MTNSLGTYNIINMAIEHDARFLMASTSESYGDPDVSPQPETYWGHVNPVGPRSCYDESKRFSEALTMTFIRHHGLDGRIIRIFNTYGPRMRLDDGRVVPNFMTQALTGKPMSVYGDGSQTRSFCYVIGPGARHIPDDAGRYEGRSGQPGQPERDDRAGVREKDTKL